MNLRSVSIIFYQGKFYIPSSQESVSGIIIDAEPVYVIDAEISELVKVIENVLLTPRPQVPDLTRDEWKKRKDPVLIATGAKSWKELARKGASYNIGWSDKQKRLDIARVDKQGKWEFDPEKAQTFPVTTPLETIAKIILDDIGSMIVVISEFSLGAPIIRLSVNAMKWCQVSLLVENRNIYLGAERIDYVIKHLLEGFSDQEKNSLGLIDGFSVYWVLSLSEAHTSLYMSNESNGKLLVWQDSESRVIDTLKMSEYQKRDWIQKLLTLQKMFQS